MCVLHTYITVPHFEWVPWKSTLSTHLEEQHISNSFLEEKHFDILLITWRKISAGICSATSFIRSPFSKQH